MIPLGSHFLCQENAEEKWKYDINKDSNSIYGVPAMYQELY